MLCTNILICNNVIFLLQSKHTNMHEMFVLLDVSFNRKTGYIFERFSYLKFHADNCFHSLGIASTMHDYLGKF